MAEERQTDPATPELVLSEMFAEIRAGAGESRCDISPEAKEMFERRYHSSVAARLKVNVPGDYWENHKHKVLPVGTAHGKIAGVICRFHLDIGTPNTPTTVSPMMLAKAGHMMELECQSYLQLIHSAREKEGRSIANKGGYCW